MLKRIFGVCAILLGGFACISPVRAGAAVPVIQNMQPIPVNEGGTAVVTTAMLLTTDADDAAAALTYTLAGGPLFGTLRKSSVAIPIGGTFSQADIDGGLIDYVHGGGEFTADGFGFTVRDSGGNFATSDPGFINSQFASDPPGVAYFGAATRSGANGSDGSPGFLQLTPNVNSTYGVATLPGPGRVLTSFSTTFDLYIGGTSSGTPADGLAFAFGGDIPANPVYSDYENANGLGSGLRVIFDSFSNPEFEVWYGATQVAQLTVGAGVVSTGTWVPVSITINAGVITVAHNGVTRFNSVTIPGWNPQASWAFAIGARTGGLNDFHRVDKLVITDTSTVKTELISVTGVNDPYVLTNNNPQTVQEGRTSAISNAALLTSDPDNPPTGINYTVRSLPTRGKLRLSGTSAAVGNIFSQDDVNNGRVTYSHDGSETVADSFNFTVTDAVDISANFDNNLFPPGWTNFGNAAVTGGSLHLTDTINGQIGTVIFPVGVALRQFNTTFSAFDGGGNAADGFSFSYGPFADGTYGEEGPGAGLSICFDSYNNGLPDLIGIGIKYDGVMLAEVATDPRRGSFVPVSISINNSGLVNVSYDATGTPVNLSTTISNWSPNSNWRFAFAGRTGGLNDNHWIDNFALSSGSSSPTQTFNFSITPVNDTPVLQANTGLTLNEGATTVLTNTMLNTVDSDDANSAITYTVGTAPASGGLTKSAVPLANGGTFTQADVNGGQMAYVHGGNELPTDSFTFTVKDAANATPDATILNTDFTTLPANSVAFGTTTIGDNALKLTTLFGNQGGGWALNSTGVAYPAFTATWEQYIGGGNAADGMSFNYGPFANNAPEVSEEGTVTGLAVCFDTYDNGLPDRIGIGVKYNNVFIQAENAITPRTNGFVSVTFRVDSLNRATLIWNNQTLVSNVVISGWAPQAAWRFGFGARTGGLWDNHWVTNLKIVDSSTPAPSTFAITVNPLNDAPTNNVPPPQTINEDAALVFSSGNGKLISIADPDLGGNQINVVVDSTSGIASVVAGSGAAVTGDGTTSVSITGTLAQVNLALNGMVYSPTANFAGAGNVRITSNDGGFTGAGGPKTTITNIPITIVAVADQPNATAGNLTGNEGTPIPCNFTASLVDTDGSETLTIQVTNVPAGAIFSTGTDNGGGVWSFTQAQLAGLSVQMADNGGPFNLTLTATATEASNSAVAVRNVNFSVNVNNVTPAITSLQCTSTDEASGLVTLTGVISDSGTVDTFTLTIDWGDNFVTPDVEVFPFPASASGQQSFNINHTYLDDRFYSGTTPLSPTITVTVHDNNGANSSSQILPQIANLDPIGTPVATVHVAENSNVNVVLATFTDAGVADTHHAIVDWGDGSPVDTNVTIEEPSALNGFVGSVLGNHLFADGPLAAGGATVVIFDDDNGTTGTLEMAIIVDNVAPTATLQTAPTATPGTLDAVELINIFDPSPIDAASLRFSWDLNYDGVTPQFIYSGFGNGIYAGGVTVTAFAVPLQFQFPNQAILARLMDKDGGVTDVFLQPPVWGEDEFNSIYDEADLGAAYSYTFHATGFPGGGPVTYTIVSAELPDGIASIADVGLTFNGVDTLSSPALLRAGLLTLVVTAENLAGKSTIFFVLKIKHTGGGDTPQIISEATANPNPALVGKVVQFSVVATDRNGDLLSYFWDFGDGHNSRDRLPTHKFAAAGRYDVVFVVSDGQRTTNQHVYVTVLGDEANTYAVSSAKLTFDFKNPNRSQFIVTGKMPVPATFTVPNSTVDVSIPGSAYAQTFNLNAKGVGGNTVSLFSLAVTAPGPSSSISKFTLHLKSSAGTDPLQPSLFQMLSPLGFTNKKIGKPGEQHDVTLTVVLGLQTNSTAIPIMYTCVPNKKGTGTLKK